jgi:hypothetical protein
MAAHKADISNQGNKSHLSESLCCQAKAAAKNKTTGVSNKNAGREERATTENADNIT